MKKIIKEVQKKIKNMNIQKEQQLETVFKEYFEDSQIKINKFLKEGYNRMDFIKGDTIVELKPHLKCKDEYIIDNGLMQLKGYLNKAKKYKKGILLIYTECLNKIKNSDKYIQFLKKEIILYNIIIYFFDKTNTFIIELTEEEKKEFLKKGGFKICGILKDL